MILGFPLKQRRSRPSGEGIFMERCPPLISGLLLEQCVVHWPASPRTLLECRIPGPPQTFQIRACILARAQVAQTHMRVWEVLCQVIKGKTFGDIERSNAYYKVIGRQCSRTLSVHLICSLNFVHKRLKENSKNLGHALSLEVKSSFVSLLRD